MGDPHTQERAEPEKQRADAGRRCVIWLDSSDPDGAYAALMALVEKSNARHQIEPVHTIYPEPEEP
jgi:hypothetical protein